MVIQCQATEMWKVKRLSVRHRVQYLLVRHWKCILTQIATNLDGTVLIFNSRNETADYFKCDKSRIEYGRYYKKGYKKDWKFELMI